MFIWIRNKYSLIFKVTNTLLFYCIPTPTPKKFGFLVMYWDSTLATSSWLQLNSSPFLKISSWDERILARRSVQSPRGTYSAYGSRSWTFFLKGLLKQKNLKLCCFLISLIFYAKEKRNIFQQFRFGRWEHEVFLRFLIHVLALASGSLNPLIFADLDTGRSNVADPTDPDSKHLHLNNLLWS